MKSNSTPCAAFPSVTRKQISGAKQTISRLSNKRRFDCVRQFTWPTNYLFDPSDHRRMLPFARISPVSLFAEYPGLDASSSIPATTFEPVLNIPALGVFLLVAAMFTFLQVRVRAIEEAADRRTAALDELRSIKAKSLTAVGEDAINSEQVERAVAKYRTAYEKVESLRELLPGVRVVPPPSQSITNKRMLENEAAAQQFLGITPDRSTTSNDEQQSSSLTSIQIAVLAFVALSQLSLFIFLLLDPMTSNDVLDVIDSMSIE